MSYPALVVTPATLPTGYVNSSYTTTTLTATGGSGTGYTWGWAAASGSSLPAGLTLSTGGVITGAPTTAGTYSVVVTVTDSASDSANATMAITIKAGVSMTTESTLPAGYVGSNYSEQLGATGGSGTGYTWALATNSPNPLPAGLSLSAGGLINGKPTTAAGPVGVVITVTDSVGNTDSASFSISIDAGVSFNPVPLPTGYQGTAYPTTTLTATGGSGTGYTYGWVAASGSSLPAGLTLSTGGVISGTPTAGGTFNVTITATDSVGNTASTTNSLIVEATLAITTATPLTSGSVGQAYSTTFAATGGTGTYTWTVPLASDITCLTARGLSLSSTGVLSSGGATLTTGEEGTCINFGVQVSDNATPAHTASNTFTVSVSAIAISPSSLPAAITGLYYGQTLSATGGNAPYTWAVSANSSGLTAIGLSVASSSTTTASLSGTLPSSAAAVPVTFTVKVTDSTSASATEQYTINVYAPLTLPATNPASLPSTGTTGVAYSGTIGASGGSGNYSWTVTFTGTNDNLTVTTPSTGPTISGTPGRVELNPPITFVVKVTDTTTTLSATQTYTIAVNEPNPPSLPSPNPTSLPSATQNQSYTGAINAASGTAPYTWTINGTTVTAGGIALSDSLSASNTGGNTLSIAGTPTSIGSVALTNVVVTDSLGGTASNTYTIAVNAPGSQVNGQISLSTCGGGSTPEMTVNLYTGTNTTGTPYQSTTTTNGNFTFSGVAAGPYTIVPSISGPSAVFYPATQGITAAGSDLNNENFSVLLGYTVSGNVTYTGPGTLQIGQTYLNLGLSGCGGSGNGTSIQEATLTSGGAFTIRGVPPGSYTLQAWMDPIGQGILNANDPSGNASVTVTDANVTTASVSMFNPTYGTPTENPTIGGIVPEADGFLVEVNPSTNSKNVEDANAYLVQWSTSPTLGGGTNGGQFACAESGGTCPSHIFTADGSTNVWFLTNPVAGAGSFVSDTTYYFQARSFNTLDGNSHPTGWCNYTSGGCSDTTSADFIGVKIGIPACTVNCTTVSGSVTIPAGVTIQPGATLYLGFLEFSGPGGNPIGIYANAVTPTTNSAYSYSLTVPNGLNYAVLGILDQDNIGEIGANVVTDVRQNVPASITVGGGTMTGQDITLPAGNSAATAQTMYTQTTSPGGTSTGYQINLDVEEGNKLPVAVTLTSGPNVINPVDMSSNCQYCGSAEFQYYFLPSGVTPSVGDTYKFTVAYSDGTTETGTAVNAAVTAFGSTGLIAGPSDLATGLSPAGTGASATPNFTWTYPTGASNYTFQFYLNDSSYNQLWAIPANNSKLDGFTSSQITMPNGIQWPTDPIESGNNQSGTLSSGTYYWTLQTNDDNGNEAWSQTYFIVP